MLKQPENRPTNRQAGAVKETAAEKKRTKPQQQPPRRETPPAPKPVPLPTPTITSPLQRKKPTAQSTPAESLLQRNKSDTFEKNDLKKACLHNRHLKMTILQATRKHRQVKQLMMTYQPTSLGFPVHVPRTANPTSCQGTYQ